MSVVTLQTQTSIAVGDHVAIDEYGCAVQAQLGGAYVGRCLGTNGDGTVNVAMVSEAEMAAMELAQSVRAKLPEVTVGSLKPLVKIAAPWRQCVVLGVVSLGGGEVRLRLRSEVDGRYFAVTTRTDVPVELAS